MFGATCRAYPLSVVRDTGPTPLPTKGPHLDSDRQIRQRPKFTRRATIGQRRLLAAVEKRLSTTSKQPQSSRCSAVLIASSDEPGAGFEDQCNQITNMLQSAR